MILPQGTSLWPPPMSCRPFRSSNSAALTLLCSWGLSLNHHQNSATHTSPKHPKQVNAQRQLELFGTPRLSIRLKTHSTINGVKAPPNRAKAHTTPWTRTRSSRRSQVAKAFVILGKQP